MRTSLSALALALALCFAASTALARTELIVYTAVETELMTPYKKAFEKAFPDISITWVRDSTGIITARLLAEKDAPRADVVFGLNLTSVLLLDQQGMLEPYAPKGGENAPPFMRDARDEPTWAGMSACPAALCVNTEELKRLGLPMPASWQDLADPAFRGHIVMSNPATSGAAYTIVSSWLQAFGAEDAWAFMDALDQNIKMYTQSGARPAEMAARGEVAIGLSEAAFARTLMRRGAPLRVLVPDAPLPLDMEASAIIRGTKKREAAQKLLDFSVSPEMAGIVGERACVTAQPSQTAPEARSIPERIGRYDFAEAAKNRQATIEAWRKRFDAR